MKYGTYTVISIGSLFNGERTNIGVLVFDENGDQVAAKMDTLDRAIQRGDCPPSGKRLENLKEEAERYPRHFPTRNSVNAYLNSTGACYFSICPREPLPAAMGFGDTLERIWEKFVAPMKWEEEA